jgi:hypothetical protein
MENHLGPNRGAGIPAGRVGCPADVRGIQQMPARKPARQPGKATASRPRSRGGGPSTCHLTANRAAHGVDCGQRAIPTAQNSQGNTPLPPPRKAGISRGARSRPPGDGDRRRGGGDASLSASTFSRGGAAASRARRWACSAAPVRSGPAARRKAPGRMQPPRVPGFSPRENRRVIGPGRGNHHHVRAFEVITRRRRANPTIGRLPGFESCQHGRRAASS